MGIFQITIPKPCHEDWNKMSPQEKGRFCDKCCKTVYDFSSKSITEIQRYIREHSGEKLCGRFMNDQLKEPILLEIPVRSLGNRLTASQVFLVSLLFAFGTTLFSCTTPKDETVGKLVLTEENSSPAHDLDSLSTAVTENTNPEVRLNGEVEVIRTPEIIFTEDTIDLPAVEVTDQAVPLTGGFLVGAIAYTTYAGEEVSCFDTASAGNKTEVADEPIFNEAFVVYPNPAQNFVNLKFNLDNEKNVTAEIFDMNGQLIRTLILSQQMQAGESDLQFTIEGIPPATYLLRLVRGEKTETKRLVIL